VLQLTRSWNEFQVRRERARAHVIRALICVFVDQVSEDKMNMRQLIKALEVSVSACAIVCVCV
jgi:hypothetical protein